MDATITRICELAAPLAHAQGMEIVDIELQHDGSGGGRTGRRQSSEEVPTPHQNANLTASSACRFGYADVI